MRKEDEDDNKLRRYYAPNLFQGITNLDEAKVLHMLLEFLDEENRVVIHLTKAAREFEIRLDKTMGAIERLMQAGYLTQEAKVGAKHCYRVSYDVACVDTPQNRPRILDWITN
jgi:hypothetical protein